MDPIGVYNVLKLWYQHASAQATNPSWTDMEKFRGGFQNLYQREDQHPPGLPLATHVDPVHVSDATPLEEEVEVEVRRLLPLKAGGQTHLHTDYFKQWLQGAYPGEKSKTPPWIDRWMCLV